MKRIVSALLLTLGLALASAGTLWLPRSARAQARFDANPFTLGVASGSPSDASIVLWTRLALPGLFGSRLGNDPILVRWEIAHDEAFRRPVQSGQAIASAELAHSVHVEVNGLAPDRWYWYRFMAGDAVSPAGRTRTFPAVWSSCTTASSRTTNSCVRACVPRATFSIPTPTPKSSRT